MQSAIVYFANHLDENDFLDDAMREAAYEKGMDVLRRFSDIKINRETKTLCAVSIEGSAQEISQLAEILEQERAGAVDPQNLDPSPFHAASQPPTQSAVVFCLKSVPEEQRSDIEKRRNAISRVQQVIAEFPDIQVDGTHEYICTVDILGPAESIVKLEECLARDNLGTVMVDDISQPMFGTTYRPQ